MQDLEIFRSMDNLMDIHILNSMDDIFQDDATPVVNRSIVQNDISYVNLIKSYLNKSPSNRVIFLDLVEGTNTTIAFLHNHDLIDMVDQLIIISSGDFPDGFNFINVDTFHNLTASSFNIHTSLVYFKTIFSNISKPFTFLFLNKRSRPHRDLLTNYLNERRLLDDALWSYISHDIRISDGYADFISNTNADAKMGDICCDTSWPDGLLNHRLYTDTYFSVVTETNPDMPYQYFTEKIYKVLLMGHPFILASAPGSYKFLHNAGYKTFSDQIDESFDSIIDTSTRMQRISESVEKLCNSDLPKFLSTVEDICAYNRSIFLEKIGTTQLQAHNRLYSYFKSYAQNQ